MDNVTTPRTALLAGATGLVGRALLSLLVESERYRSVHVLLRRTPPNIGATEQLQIHQVDFVRLPAAFPTLYIRHVDVWDAAETLRDVLVTGAWRRPEFQQRAAVT